MSINEIANVKVDIDGQEAGQRIEKLTKQSKAFKNELKDIKKNNKPVDPAYYDNLKKKIKETDREIRSYKKQLTDVNYVIKNLSSVSYEDLIKSQKRLKTEIKKSTRATAEEKVQLKKKKDQLALINAELQKSTITSKSSGNGFNKFRGMATALIGSLIGVVMAFRQINDISMEFEERVDNLGALTGLAGDELAWLEENAKKSSVAIIEGGIRIKQGASDIVDAYTKMGSQRPELLKNKEALAAVTEDGIILSEAAKSELEPAISALATTMNQFNKQASDSRSIINTLAAGSKEGAADIPYLSKAIEKAGTTFNLMGISVERGVGIVEAVAPKFKQAELAGNSLDKTFMKMKEKQIGYASGVFDVNDAIDELIYRFEHGESATSIFGVEHAKMVEVLVQSKSEMNRYTEAVTGTNVALEQAYKNTNNQAAALAQARNQYQLTAIELGQELGPAVVMSTNGFTYFLKAIISGMHFYKEHRQEIKAIAVGLIFYTIAVSAATKQTKFFTAATWLANKALAAFNLVAKANPYYLLAAALVAVISYFLIFDDSADKAAKSLNKFNDSTEDYLKNIKVEENKLADQFKNGELSAHEYTKEMDALNQKIEAFHKLNADIADGENLYTKLKDADSDLASWVAGKGAFSEISDMIVFLEGNVESLDSQISDLNGADSTYMKDMLSEARNQQLEDLKIINEALAEKKKPKKKKKKKIGNGEQEIEKSKFDPTKLGNEQIAQIVSLSNQKIKAYENANAEEVKVLEEKFAREETLRKADHNKQLALLAGDKKAQKALTNKFDLEELRIKADHLNTLSAVLENQLKNGVDLDGVVLSDEANAKLQTKLDKLKLALSEVGVLMGELNNPETPEVNSMDPLITGIGKAVEIATLLTNSIGGVFSALSDKENAEMEQYEINMDKRREKLESDLDSGAISRKQYDAQIDVLDNKVDKKKKALLSKQAKREKTMAIFGATISTAQGVAKALGSAPPPANFILAALVGALGLVQIGLIASTKTPQYAQGNYNNVIGASDGRTYRAKQGTYGTQITDGPTLIPGIGLVGEGYKPQELIFSGEDTTRIMNSPRLVEAINYTITQPQFAAGNYPEGGVSTTNYNMNTGNLEALLLQLIAKADNPVPAEMVWSSFLEKKDEWDGLESDVVANQ